MGTQKHRLSETVLLSTHNIMFACKIRDMFLSGVLLRIVDPIRQVLAFTKAQSTIFKCQIQVFELYLIVYDIYMYQF